MPTLKSRKSQPTGLRVLPWNYAQFYEVKLVSVPHQENE